MSKRAALVANSCWNIFKFRLNLIELLVNEGWEVFVITPLDEYIRYKEHFPSVKHITLQKLDRKSTSPLKHIRLTFELRRIYRRIKPDIIIHYTHKPNIFGGVAARIEGINSVGVITGLGYSFLHKGWLNKIIRTLYLVSNRCHKKLIFENPDDLELFVNYNLIDRKKTVSVMGCGVDLDYYSNCSSNESHNVPLVFSFIGRLLYDKGIREYVAAAESVIEKGYNCEFRIVGELDSGNPSMVKRQELLEWIEDGIVSYHGFVEDVRNVLSDSDCVVLPSYREGMSRVIMEALSMAKPVIATDVPGCRQAVIDGENGFLVEPASSESLTMAMERFNNLSKEERESMGFVGRRIAEKNFNSEKIARELYEIISQVYFCS